MIRNTILFQGFVVGGIIAVPAMAELDNAKRVVPNEHVAEGIFYYNFGNLVTTSPSGSFANAGTSGSSYRISEAREFGGQTWAPVSWENLFATTETQKDSQVESNWDPAAFASLRDRYHVLERQEFNAHRSRFRQQCRGYSFRSVGIAPCRRGVA